MIRIQHLHINHSLSLYRSSIFQFEVTKTSNITAVKMVLLRKHQRYMTALLISTSIMLLLYFQNSVLVFTKGSYGFISKKVPCACSICVTDRGNSHWFSERYDPNVPLLLNSTNSVLSANVSRWWKVRNTAAKSMYSPYLPWFCGQGCIYLIQNTVKTIAIGKYFTILRSFFNCNIF